MPDYVILIQPSANRVYTDSAPGLLAAELRVFAARLGLELGDIGPREIGGVAYVGATAAAPLTEPQLAALANLSARYAMFEVVGELLRPITAHPADRFDSDLLSIPKYPGKTNELFTRLLVNVTALAVTAEPFERPLYLLDPLCGRGTTLHQGMTYGWHVTGCETDGKDFDAHEQFVKTWLRTKRIKHTADSGVLRRNKVRLGRRLEIDFGLSKEEYQAGDVRRLRFFHADTFTVDELLPHRSVDLVVTDAPYGVAHGSRSGEQLRRSPRDLLGAAIPVWTRVLRPGGALGLSWNTHTLPRAELLDLLAGAGLSVVTPDEFAHRVDQSIHRDLVVATRPAS